MRPLVHVSNLMPRNCSHECLQSLRIGRVHAACLVIYSSFDFVKLKDFFGFDVVVPPSFGDYIKRDSL